MPRPDRIPGESLPGRGLGTRPNTGRSRSSEGGEGACGSGGFPVLIRILNKIADQVDEFTGTQVRLEAKIDSVSYEFNAMQKARKKAINKARKSVMEKDPSWGQGRKSVFGMEAFRSRSGESWGSSSNSAEDEKEYCRSRPISPRSACEAEAVQEEEVQPSPEPEVAEDVVVEGPEAMTRLVSADSQNAMAVQKGREAAEQVMELLFHGESLMDLPASNGRHTTRTKIPSSQTASLVCGWTKGEVDAFTDIVMAVVIILNSVSIAMSSDVYVEWVGWILIDAVFLIIFMLEMVLKVLVVGFKERYCGNDRLGSSLEAILVLADASQLIALMLGTDPLEDNSPSASLYRIARLVRLGRIARVFRIGFFNDFLKMINGMVGGTTTLLWSFLLTFIPVFLMAMTMRETLGRKGLPELGDDDMAQYFSSVPRSVFTVLRCALGDCNDESGRPLFVMASQTHGAGYGILYSAFVFIMTIGLFNVISAIYVETTLAHATFAEIHQRRERLQDQDLFAYCVCTLMKCIVKHSDTKELLTSKRLSSCPDIIANMQVSNELFDRAIRDKEARWALDKLDISTEDHLLLFGILDADNNKSMYFKEMITGLQKLRGESRRSDIVAVDLMVRSIQEKVDYLLDHWGLW
eukprot:TRINITY_DN14363_c1_g2_i1.p1 TRINITY_DN14363_c1_g2~~TRINITY_DN14363_c1_g2_i1.p1  ORF type:complete len:636 (-),score=122.46 TRINITY_DN14363_c1_g2_i1:90-1997(-)